MACSIFADIPDCWDYVSKKTPRSGIHGALSTSYMSKQVQFNPVIYTTWLDMETKYKQTDKMAVNFLNPAVEYVVAHVLIYDGFYNENGCF